jgi:hypothetical protein
MSERAIKVILEVLNGFEMVSGLSVNTNKTQLMVCVIDAWDIGEKIHGIEVVDSIRVLGIFYKFCGLLVSRKENICISLVLVGIFRDIVTSYPQLE